MTAGGVGQQDCPTNSGGTLPGALGRRGSPRRRAKQHPSAGLVVRHVGVAYQASTAIEWQAFSLRPISARHTLA